MKCFYHNDIDGRAAGAMVARFTGNYSKDNYIEYDYGKPFPTESVREKEMVYIVDLSFSENTVDKLRELVAKKCEIVWCDHHASTVDVLDKFPEFNSIKGIRVEGISGALLTWMYFNNETDQKKAPYFLQLISDFDCWHMKDENTMPFKYSIESVDYDALDIIWNRLMASHLKHDGLLENMISNGSYIEQYVKHEYKQYRKRYAYESEINGFSCLVVNRGCNSLVFGDKIKEYPVVIIWTFNGEQYKYSIYTERDDIDVSKIAEKYGGGGHRKAAGFTTKEQILKTF